MTKNPLTNALCAIIYISLVSSFLFYGPKENGPGGSVLMPIAMLSLFVLSASVMALIFFYQPARLYLDGEKERAVSLTFKTVGIFALVTFILLFVMLFVLAP